MIENVGSYREPEYILYCDGCGKGEEGPFDSFDEAREWKRDAGRDEGWTSAKTDGGEWQDRCPSCNPFRNASSQNRKPIRRSSK